MWPDEPTAPGQDRVLFEQGQPVAIRLAQPARTLREGLLTLLERQRAPFAFYEADLLGESPNILRGRVDTWELLAESLRENARDDIVESVLGRFGASLLRMQPGVDLGRFKLDQSERPLVELIRAAPANVDALVRGSGLPSRLGRRLVYMLAITKAVAPYEGQAESTSPSAATGTTGIRSMPANLRKTPPGTRISSAPSGVQFAVPPNAAVPSPDGSRRPSQSAMPLPPLMIPDVAAGSGGAGASIRVGSSTSIIPSAPSALTPALATRWQEITARSKLIDNENYFDMLGVSRKSKADEVKNAYFALAKVWHPDRLAPELASLKPLVEQVFSYLSEAHDTLTNEDKRLKYTQSVKEGGGTPATDRMMTNILDGAMQFQNVELLAKKQDFDGALQLLTRILTASPDEPDYHAMRAWLLMQKHPGQGAPLSDMLESASAAIDLHADHEKANFYKGLILKRMGRTAEAYKFFRKATQINPRNVEAAREVRLSNMRGERTSKAPPAPTGFLGSLFKKK
jgi:curved DNA-binding protein CbpA